MTLIAWFILIFTILQMLVALTNFLIGSNLPETGRNYDDMVSVLIPARNEENNIGNILEDLIKQDHNNIEIIVFNDQSEDRTAESSGNILCPINAST
jgi:chlorobactene glucosyltransferase